MKERTWQRLSRVARNTHTLGALDHARYLVSRARSHRSNHRFVRRHPGLAVPPAPLAFEAFGHTDYERYLRTGVEHARFVAEIAREHAPPSDLRVLEWGCGPARIIRHLPGLLAGRAGAMVGADFNPETIAWCRRCLPGLTFERNDLEPPLPFPERSFDFVYAISVFTHLNEGGWVNWLREMHRVLDDAGVLLFTTHGRNYLPKLLPDERELFMSGQPVFRTKAAEGKKLFAAFHPREFVLGSLPSGFRVLAHVETSAVPDLIQDVWVLTKTATMPAVAQETREASRPPEEGAPEST